MSKAKSVNISKGDVYMLDVSNCQEWSHATLSRRNRFVLAHPVKSDGERILLLIRSLACPYCVVSLAVRLDALMCVYPNELGMLAFKAGAKLDAVQAPYIAGMCVDVETAFASYSAMHELPASLDPLVVALMMRRDSSSKFDS